MTTCEHGVTPLIDCEECAKQRWATPWHIVRAVERDTLKRKFALDVCAEPWSAKATRFFCLPIDGMLQDWLDCSWCNPPYRNQVDWLVLAKSWGERGKRVACLVNAATSAEYWRPLVFNGGVCDFYEGRISHIHPITRKPRDENRIAQALVLFGPGFTPGRVRIRSAKTGQLIEEVRNAAPF
jgi:hypothetical protein